MLIPLLASPAVAEENCLARVVPFKVSSESRNLLDLKLGPGVELATGDRVVVLGQQAVLGAGKIVLDQGLPRGELDWLEVGFPTAGEVFIVGRDLPEQLDASLPPGVLTRPQPDTAGRTTTAPATSTQPAGASRAFEKTAVVAAVRPGDHPTLRLTMLDGGDMGIGDRFDIYRHAKYVGFARVTTIVASGAEADVLMSFTQTPVQPGDLAVRRATGSADSGITDCPGRVFRLDGDYALVSLGEADGILPGDRLVGRTANGHLCGLQVDRTYQDHCGATIVAPAGRDSIRLGLWDAVGIEQPPRLVVNIPRNAWRHAVGSWLVVMRSDLLPTGASPGDFAVLEGYTEGLGVVLLIREHGHRTTTAPANASDLESDRFGCFVYVPGVWHTEPHNTQGHDQPPTTQPVD